MNDKLKARIEKYLDEFMLTHGDNLTQEELKSFIGKYLLTTNRCNHYSNVRFLNEILRDRGAEEWKGENNYGLIGVEDRILSKDEILEICGLFINYSDKFLIYGLFNGIMGYKYNEMINLKTSQINKDCSEIYLKDRIIECDPYLQHYLRETLKEESYKLYLNEHNEAYTSGEFYYNMSSPFVLKSKPSKKNDNGLLPYSQIGLQNRIRKLSNEANKHTKDKVLLTGKSLYKSHVLYKMSRINKDWTIEEIGMFLKANNLTGNISEVHRNFHDKYKNKCLKN